MNLFINIDHRASPNRHPKDMFRKIFLVALVFLVIKTGISQNEGSSTIKGLTQNCQESSEFKDTIWFFYPFTINVSVGMWMPLGKMKPYYDPSFQLSFGFGIMLTPKVKLELGIAPRFLVNTKKISVMVDDTLRETNTPVSGSIGGGFNIILYRNRIFCLEFLPSLSWEPLDTKIRKPGAKEGDESTVDISAVGYSLGMNTRINTFRNNNIGIKILYGNSNYNSDPKLITDLGGSYWTLSLCYRWPGRDSSTMKNYRKYYPR